MNSSQLNVQTLAVRIEKLESANRRWRSAGAIALLFVISLLLLSARRAERVAAAAKPDRVEPDVLRVQSVEAQDFVLKDADGHVYARFGLNPSLMPTDQNGRLFLAPGSPRFYTMPGQVLPGQASGQASLQFFDERGQLVWSAPNKPQFMPVK